MNLRNCNILATSPQTQPKKKFHNVMSLALHQRRLYGKPRLHNAGKESDPETGLYYFGARYLDPKTGRWISGDPALGEYVPSAPVSEEARKRNGSLPGMGGVFNYVNLHVYHYAGNNPVKYVDPNGKTPVNYEERIRTIRADDIERNKYAIGEIPGYPESGNNSWRRANDQAFTIAVNQYNRRYNLSEGDDAYVSPRMLKAQAMVESGGHPDAFATDPLQVNNPLDWDDRKIDIAGLELNQQMTPTISAVAALEWWRYKGYIHDDSGAETTWRGNWEAYRRYNGSLAPAPIGSTREEHRDWYADRVIELSQ